MGGKAFTVPAHDLGLTSKDKDGKHLFFLTVSVMDFGGGTGKGFNVAYTKLGGKAAREIQDLVIGYGSSFFPSEDNTWLVGDVFLGQ